MADSPLSAIDLILSCSVCQATLSSIHREDGQDSGLRRTDDVQSGRIPKLWLTECTHLTCGKHFEGGGVPFHSAEQTPRAPCPVCSVEKNDRSKKDLFYINGTSEGEYDSNIPEAYFKTPPINLGGGSDPAFDALLFQYLSLIRFGSRIHKSAIRSENSLRRWEDKRAEIVRSLSRVAPLREALLAAGRKLFALGQNVSAIELTLKTVGASLAPQQPQAGQQSDPRLSYKASRNDGSVTQVRRQSDVGSRLAQGSATNLSMLSKDFRTFRHQDHESTLDTKEGGSSAKRKRLDVGDEVPRTVTKGAFGKAHSRDLMPPPPAPAELPQTLVHGTDQHNLSDPLRHSGLEEHNKCQYVTTPPRHVLPHATPRKNGFVDRATQEPLNWARVASPCKNGEYVQHSPSVGIQSHQRPQEVPFDQPSYRPPSSFSRPYSHYMQELTQAGSGFTYSRGNHAVNAQEQNYLSPSQQSPCFPRFLRPMATPVSHSNPRIMYQRSITIQGRTHHAATTLIIKKQSNSVSPSRTVSQRQKQQ
ncbi:hypothetical protein MMC21_003018 [Puttea exsequens]|nr:hypothetical protein [Puttea exsequens]